LDTGSSTTNFNYQEDDVLLPDIGDDSDVGEGAYMTYSSLLWKDLENYIRHPDTFTVISRLQNNARFSD
jgi:hypothetical protein